MSTEKSSTEQPVTPLQVLQNLAGITAVTAISFTDVEIVIDQADAIGAQILLDAAQKWPNAPVWQIGEAVQRAAFLHRLLYSMPDASGATA